MENSSYGQLHQFIAWSVILSVVVLSGTAQGQVGTCAGSSEPHTNFASVKTFKINRSSFTVLGITEDQAENAIVLGASVWNEQGNGGAFQYTGGSTRTTNLPDTLAGCVAETPDVDYSLVRVVTDCSAPKAGFDAYTFARCGGTQFEVIFYRQDSGAACANRNYGNGAVTGGNDLAGLMAHEFGHPQDIGHPSNGEFATMGNDDNPTARSRNLYHWDYKCSNEQTGHRNADVYSRIHTSSVFTADITYMTSENVVKATSGLTDDNGTLKWAAGYNRTSAASWDEDANGSYSDVSGVGISNGPGFVAGFFRETATTDRLMYTFREDKPTDYTSETSVHEVFQAVSTDEFSTRTLLPFSYCTSMTGAGGTLSCSSTATMKSARPIAVGWLPTIGHSVVAWLNHDNGSDGSSASSNRIYISVGRANSNNFHLAEPHDTGIRSAVGPGLVCRENLNGTAYDCILGYVDITDMSNPIKIARYSVAWGTDRYELTQDSTVYSSAVGGTTANSITLWYLSSASKFYMAFKGSASLQKVIVQSSTDGTSWSTVTSGLADSLTPPSAASMFAGPNNLITYTR